MFIRVWRFRVAPGKEREFERVNGPNGDWTRLFEQAPGYLGTHMKPIKRAPGEYQTVDQWESREAWEAFRRDFADAYQRLDGELESLTTSETLVSEEEFLDELRDAPLHLADAPPIHVETEVAPKESGG